MDTFQGFTVLNGRMHTVFDDMLKCIETHGFRRGFRVTPPLWETPILSYRANCSTLPLSSLFSSFCKCSPKKIETQLIILS